MATGYIVQGDRIGSMHSVGKNPRVNFRLYSDTDDTGISPALAYHLEAKLLRTLRAQAAGMSKTELSALLKMPLRWHFADMLAFVEDNYLYKIPDNKLVALAAQADAGGACQVLVALKEINKNLPKVLHPAPVYGSSISKKYCQRNWVSGVVFPPQEARPDTEGQRGRKGHREAGEVCGEDLQRPDGQTCPNP